MDLPKNYDRSKKNKSDGRKFYGYDDKETKETTWYDENGSLDCVTKTPSDDKQENMTRTNRRINICHFWKEEWIPCMIITAES